jgi:hypothetical protein
MAFLLVMAFHRLFKYFINAVNSDYPTFTQRKYLWLMLSLPHKHYDGGDRPLYSLSSLITFCAGVYVLNKKQFMKNYEGLNTVDINHLNYY